MGYSPSLPSCRLLGEAALQEAVLESFSWYVRVPTASNVADAASRLEYERLLLCLPGAKWAEPVVPASWTAEVEAPGVGVWFRDRQVSQHAF